jgi:hypothetical protein
MKSSDLNRLIKIANQIAEENASVYGKQIKKSYIEKDYFRPDSFIRLAEEETPDPTDTTSSTTTVDTKGGGTGSTGAGTATTVKAPTGPIQVKIPKLEWSSLPDDSFEITKLFYQNIITAIAKYPVEGRAGGKLVAVNLAMLVEGKPEATAAPIDRSAGFVESGSSVDGYGTTIYEYQHPDGRIRKVIYNDDGSIAREAYYNAEGKYLNPETMLPESTESTTAASKKYRIILSADSTETPDTEPPASEPTSGETSPENSPQPQLPQPSEPPKPEIVVKKLTDSLQDYAYFWNKYQGALSGSKWQIHIGDYRDIERTLYQLGVPKFKVNLEELPNIKIEMCNQLNNISKQIQEKLNYIPQPESLGNKMKNMTGKSGGWWSGLLQKMIDNQRG